MLYPFIYTRSKRIDYRVVTSQILDSLPSSIVNISKKIARTSIDADDRELEEPTWVLVKNDCYLLWGVAVVNNVLGEVCRDKENRLVRGFFGFISDNQIESLPYGISYFKELYNTYVTPIWDSYDQNEQITCLPPPMKSDDFIIPSLLLNNEINVACDLCRIFPYCSKDKGLIEAVFASMGNCSIATNVHSKKQYIEFGEDKLSFMNVVMSNGSDVKNKEDIKIIVNSASHINIQEQFIEENTVQEDAFCSNCGKLLLKNDTLCPECKSKQQNKKYLKFGLYLFIVLICLMLIMKGCKWGIINLSPKQTQEVIHSYDDINVTHRDLVYLKTKKVELNIQDATKEDTFKIDYESSSNIENVNTSEDWIYIVPSPQQYTKSGIIKFICNPLTTDSRDGTISIVNKEGEKLVIPIHQTNTKNKEIGGNKIRNKVVPLVQEMH